jgi:uncharacterized membrane protein
MFKNRKAAIGASRTQAALLGVAFAILAALVVAMNIENPIAYTMYNVETISYERATVIAVRDETTEAAEGLPGWYLGSQTIALRFDNGPMAGREIELRNVLSATHNIYVRKGARVIVKADRPDNAAPYYTLYSYNRAPGVLAVALIFGALMLIVGRFKGLRSFLGLGISLFFILALLLPAVYRGRPPVATAVVTVLLIAAFSILLLHGFSRKAGVALLAVASGVLLSAVFFVSVSALLSLTGYNIEEAEELILVSRATGLKIGELLFAGVLVASIGAVIDMSVSVASSMYEIKERRPDISARELFRSGMRVGGDMIGSMSTTLILAFVGSSFATLLSLLAYGSRFDQILSSDYAAVEIAYSVTASLAVTAAVPITAGLCVSMGGRRARAPRTRKQQRRAL